jgi:acetylornithine deacetylase
VASNVESGLLGQVERLRDKQLAWTRELIAIPTVNPYAGDGSGVGEAAGQDWVQQRMRELGASVRRVPVPADVYDRGGVLGPADRRWEGRENVVAEWTIGSGVGPTILLNNHMDTVGTAGMTIDPFDPAVKDGRLFGRGSTDTKGNLVIGLIAVEALLKNANGLNGRIVFTSVVDEECNGSGAGTVACCLAGVSGDVAICLDGAGGDLKTGCQGIVTGRVDVPGRAGHSSVGGGSVNAIDKAIAVKAGIEAIGEENRRKYPGCLLSFGVFRSGSVPAMVPHTAELHFNMSYDQSEAAATQRELGRWDGTLFRERFEKQLGEFCAGDAWLAEHPAVVTWVKDVQPYRSDNRHPGVAAVMQAIADVRGSAPGETPGVMPAWCDAGHLARLLNVPALILGHGVAGVAHGQVEYASIDELYTGAKVVALSLRRLLACEQIIRKG